MILKQISKLQPAAALAGAVCALAGGAALAADVEVEMQAVKAAAGPLYVALQSREQFMGPGGDYGATIEAPAAGDLKVTVAGVPPGEYAVSVWHDIDADGVFDVDEVGRPLDGFAMSGPPAMGPPSFDSAKIVVPADGLTVTLQMTYFGG